MNNSFYAIPALCRTGDGCPITAVFPFLQNWLLFNITFVCCLKISHLSPTRLPHCHACILILDCSVTVMVGFPLPTFILSIYCFRLYMLICTSHHAVQFPNKWALPYSNQFVTLSFMNWAKRSSLSRRPFRYVACTHYGVVSTSRPYCDSRAAC